MTDFKEITTRELTLNPFQMIGTDWLLITAKKDGKYNSMTAAWGGLGVMWGKDVAFIVLRPQRYTKEFVDASETFSICVLPEEYRQEYKYLGSVSGRDEDKLSNTRLHVEETNNTPYFAEANTTLICRKLYAQEMSKDCMLNDWADERWYPDGDYHIMYVAEIEKVLVK